METLHPATAEELAAALAGFAAQRTPIRTGGQFTKNQMGGPLCDAAAAVSTDKLNRVLQYEPKDLTISVEAGLPYAELARLLAENHQMIPLDPPLAESATIGGVVAANCSGPRRRLYGTARDLVIGMQFATLEGKLIQSGGMVVKNVAGLDMGKLMIGSFGTLAVVTVLNFKLTPLPPETATFLFVFADLDQAMARRDAVLKSVLQPAAIDLLNPPAAALRGREGWLLAVQAGGSAAVIRRYERELDGAEVLRDEAEREFWREIREFAPGFMAAHPEGAVVRVSTTLTGIADAMAHARGPAIARAGNGVIYIGRASDPAAAGMGVVEWGKDTAASRPARDDFAIMEKVKDLMDPHRILNAGRLYGWL
jgi:glycolate oxidase FAD binding subunit